MCLNIAPEYLYTSTVFAKGKIGMSSPYLFMSTSLNQCAKKLFTFINPASISLSLFAFDFILLGGRYAYY